jgi:hypothetical protein
LQVGIVDMSAINANKLFTIRTIFINVLALTASFAGLLLLNLLTLPGLKAWGFLIHRLTFKRYVKNGNS